MQAGLVRQTGLGRSRKKGLGTATQCYACRARQVRHADLGKQDLAGRP
jgi:hypothetical protein